MRRFVTFRFTITGGLIAFLLLLAGTFARARQQEPAITRVLAVGISRYSKLPGGQQLQFAERDAASFAELMQNLGVASENVRVLAGSQATTAAVKSAIGNWLAGAAQNDTAILFFSGHGLVERSYNEPYLLCFDSDPKDPFATALSISDLEKAISKRVRAHRVLVLADAMRRDFFDPETDPAASDLFARSFAQLSTSREGVVSLLANSPGEFSREGQRWDGHGAFTKHLIQAISSAQTDATIDETIKRLSDQLAQDTSGKQHVWRSASPIAGLRLPNLRADAKSSAAREPVVAVTEPRATTTQPARAEQAPPVSESSATAPATPRMEEPRAAGTTQTSTVGPRDNPRPTTGPTRPEQTPGSEAQALKPSSTTQNTTAKVSPPPPSRSPDAVAKAAESPQPNARDMSTEIRPNRVGMVPPRTEIVNPERMKAATPFPGAPASPSPGAAPRPAVIPPSVRAVAVEGAATATASAVSSVPTSGSIATAPSPLALQIEFAIAANNLISPRGSSAWDLYQRLATEAGASDQLGRLRPLLANALVERGRAAITTDIRIDNISDKLDDIKSAGQMLARSKTLGTADTSVLEKLSAVEALIALQFYDEAERALAPLQDAKLAAVENASGIIYHGKLDSFRAERAFKRAIELDPKLAAAHYNLALVYRGSQNDQAVTQLELAAASDPDNVVLVSALGDEYFTRKDFKRAADVFRRAIQLKPLDDTLHTRLGHALFSQGLTEDANRAYQRANELRSKQ